MKINIPLGSKIVTTEDKNSVRIKVPDTKFWVLGEKIDRSHWNTYLIDPRSNYKELTKENVTTNAFIIFSNMVLNTPFPYNGKRSHDFKFIKKLIKTKIKKIYVKTNRKSSKVQVNSKRRIKNGPNKGPSNKSIKS